MLILFGLAPVSPFPLAGHSSSSRKSTGRGRVFPSGSGRGPGGVERHRGERKRRQCHRPDPGGFCGLRERNPAGHLDLFPGGSSLQAGAAGRHQHQHPEQPQADQGCRPQLHQGTASRRPDFGHRNPLFHPGGSEVHQQAQAASKSHQAVVHLPLRRLPGLRRGGHGPQEPATDSQRPQGHRGAERRNGELKPGILR